MEPDVNGDELESRLEQLHPASFGWALSCCAWNRSEAEDVLQTTYLKVLDGRARFDGRSSLKTWLFSVIRRTAMEEHRSFLRRSGSGVSGVTRDSQASLRSEAGDEAKTRRPDRIVEGSEDRARIREALAHLAGRQREVLDLVFYHELSIAEAADVMGVGLGTARTHYERGKSALLERLAGQDQPAKPAPTDSPGTRTIPLPKSVR